MTNVLLLEPNTLLARMYAEALTLAGHVVRQVTSAQAAIHAADESCPDVVIVELQIAGHNGIEFLHEFRSYPEWRQIPVIINTSLHSVRVRDSRQVLQDELGVVAVLYKPMATLADICHTVREHSGGVL